MPCQNLPNEASRFTGGGCAAAVLGFALMTSSAVGGGATAPKEEWGLPAGMGVRLCPLSAYWMQRLQICQHTSFASETRLSEAEPSNKKDSTALFQLS